MFSESEQSESQLTVHFKLLKLANSFLATVLLAEAIATAGKLAIPTGTKTRMQMLKALAKVYVEHDGQLPLSEHPLQWRIPLDPSMPGDLVELIHACNHAYDRFVNAYTSQQQSETSLVSPSAYASQWPSEQEKNPHLLCGRPTAQRGLPLSTQHDVFRQFIVDADQPLPRSEWGDEAWLAALQLCASMGDAFDDESARSYKFDQCIQGLFPFWKPKHRLAPASETCYGLVDRVFLFSNSNNIPVFREDEDTGNGGDIYMQIARDYDLYRKTTNTEDGAPAFLVCVAGTILTVSGGFFDGDNAIVEPLARPCSMLADDTGRRPTELARVLYALRQGVDSLGKNTSRRNQSPPPRSMTPRVYRDCTAIDNDQFVGRLADFEKSAQAHRLVFPASLLRDDRQDEVVVKLVNSSYGVKVHQYLAKKGHAPQLYGHRVLEGAPTAYVMERLTAPWISLSDFIQNGRTTSPSFQPTLEGIKEILDGIIVLLKDAKMVHGDLRANNIMVKSSEDNRLQVMLIDFDWAGVVGEATYPLSRNNSIPGIVWPGFAGGLIGLDDDAQLVASWWRF